MMGVDTQARHLPAGEHPSFLRPPSAQPQSTNLPAVQTAVLPPPSTVAGTSASPKSGQFLVHGLFVTIPNLVCNKRPIFNKLNFLSYVVGQSHKFFPIVLLPYHHFTDIGCSGIPLMSIMETFWFTTGAYLSVNDLRMVYKALYRVRMKWRAIGRELDLDLYVLSNIEDQYAIKGNDRCLEEMLSAWLKRLTPRPTWQSLVAALQDETVGEEGVAADLEQSIETCE